MPTSCARLNPTKRGTACEISQAGLQFSPARPNWHLYSTLNKCLGNHLWSSNHEKYRDKGMTKSLGQSPVKFVPLLIGCAWWVWRLNFIFFFFDNGHRALDRRFKNPRSTLLLMESPIPPSHGFQIFIFIKPKDWISFTPFTPNPIKSQTLRDWGCLLWWEVGFGVWVMKESGFRFEVRVWVWGSGVWWRLEFGWRRGMWWWDLGWVWVKEVSPQGRWRWGEERGKAAEKKRRKRLAERWFLNPALDPS